MFMTRGDLHRAASSGNEKKVKTLLRCVHSRNIKKYLTELQAQISVVFLGKKRTPIAHAVESSNWHIVGLLAEWIQDNVAPAAEGTDPYSLNFALKKAGSFGPRAPAEASEQKQFFLDQGLLDAARKGKHREFGKLLKNGARLDGGERNKRNREKRCITFCGQRMIPKTIIRLKPIRDESIAQRQDCLNCLLILATRTKQPRLASQLCSEGANLSCTDSYGHSAIYYIAKKKMKSSEYFNFDYKQLLSLMLKTLQRHQNRPKDFNQALAEHANEFLQNMISGEEDHVTLVHMCSEGADPTAVVYKNPRTRTVLDRLLSFGRQSYFSKREQRIKTRIISNILSAIVNEQRKCNRALRILSNYPDIADKYLGFLIRKGANPTLRLPDLSNKSALEIIIEKQHLKNLTRLLDCFLERLIPLNEQDNQTQLDRLLRIMATTELTALIEDTLYDDYVKRMYVAKANCAAILEPDFQDSAFCYAITHKNTKFLSLTESHHNVLRNPESYLTEREISTSLEALATQPSEDLLYAKIHETLLLVDLLEKGQLQQKTNLYRKTEGGDTLLMLAVKRNLAGIVKAMTEGILLEHTPRDQQELDRALVEAYKQLSDPSEPTHKLSIIKSLHKVGVNPFFPNTDIPKEVEAELTSWKVYSSSALETSLEKASCEYGKEVVIALLARDNNYQKNDYELLTKPVCILAGKFLTPLAWAVGTRNMFAVKVLGTWNSNAPAEHQDHDGIELALELAQTNKEEETYQILLRATKTVESLGGALMGKRNVTPTPCEPSAPILPKDQPDSDYEYDDEDEEEGEVPPVKRADPPSLPTCDPSAPSDYRPAEDEEEEEGEEGDMRRRFTLSLVDSEINHDEATEPGDLESDLAISEGIALAQKQPLDPYFKITQATLDKINASILLHEQENGSSIQPHILALHGYLGHGDITGAQTVAGIIQQSVSSQVIKIAIEILIATAEAEASYLPGKSTNSSCEAENDSTALCLCKKGVFSSDTRGELDTAKFAKYIPQILLGVVMFVSLAIVACAVFLPALIENLYPTCDSDMRLPMFRSNCYLSP